MALHAAAVDILIEKGRFEPEVALGIAEAIEASVMQAQFVTIPILDARLQELRADMRIGLMSLEGKLSASVQELHAKIDQKFGELDAKIERKCGELDTKIERKCGELDAKIERKFGELDAKIDLKFGQLDAKIDLKFGEFKAELVRWVFLVVLGNVALTAAATAVLNAFKNL